MIADDCAGLWLGVRSGRRLVGGGRLRVGEADTAILRHDNYAECHDGEDPHTEPKNISKYNVILEN